MAWRSCAVTESEREEETFIEAAISWKRATVTSVSLLPLLWVYRSTSCFFTSSSMAEEICSMSPESTGKGSSLDLH